MEKTQEAGWAGKALGWLIGLTGVIAFVLLLKEADRYSSDLGIIDAVFGLLLVVVGLVLISWPHLLHPRISAPALGAGLLAVVVVRTDHTFAVFTGAFLVAWWAAWVITQRPRQSPAATDASPARTD